MLQFVDVSDFIHESLELDDYVPLIIRWGELEYLDPNNWMMLPPRLYWSMSDERSLLEIGIDSKSGIILFIKVVLAGRVTIHNSEFHINASLPARSGVPICKIDDWSSSIEFPSGYYREEKGFELHLGSNHVCVIFYDLEVVSQIVCGRVRFGLDLNNYLCLLEVVGFSDEEIEQLTETLRYQCLQPDFA